MVVDAVLLQIPHTRDRCRFLRDRQFAVITYLKWVDSFRSACWGEERRQYKAIMMLREEKSSVMIFCLRFSSSKAARKAGRCKIPQAALNRQKLGQHCYCRGKRRERARVRMRESERVIERGREREKETGRARDREKERGV